jgi:probable F420-dependent oxidoreductase
LKLGAVIPFWLDRPVLEAVQIARNAEKAGLHELWIGEMATFDGFALAGAIARETKRIRLCVGPLAVSLRDPAAFALGLFSVATLGGRPATLALGASTPVVVEQWHGGSSAHVVERVEETVSALRPLLAGERTSFVGLRVSSDGFRLPAALPGAEIAVAAFAPKMLQLAARHADRIVVNLLTPAQVARTRVTIDREAQATERPPPPLVAWVAVALDPDEAAWQELARQLVVYVGANGYAEMFTEAGFGDVVAFARSGAGANEIAARIPHELITAVAAVGDRDMVAVRIAAFAAAGADVVAVVPVTANDPGGKRVFATVAAAS